MRLIFLIALLFSCCSLLFGCSNIEKRPIAGTTNDPTTPRSPASVICGLDANNEAAIANTVDELLIRRIATHSKAKFMYATSKNVPTKLYGWEWAATDIINSKLTEHVLAPGKFAFRRFRSVIETPDAILPYLTIEGFIKIDGRGLQDERGSIALHIEKISGLGTDCSKERTSAGCLIQNQIFGDDLLIPRCPLSPQNVEFDF